MPFRTGLIVTVFFILFTFSCNEAVNDLKSLPQTAPPDTTTVRETAKTFMYGIPADSFDLVNGQIRKNELLATILLRYGISMEETEMVVRNLQPYSMYERSDRETIIRYSAERTAWPVPRTSCMSMIQQAAMYSASPIRLILLHTARRSEKKSGTPAGLSKLPYGMQWFLMGCTLRWL